MSAGRGLVCLAGVSGSGKDTAGAYLADRHGFERVALADPLKEAMMALFSLRRDQLWGDERNTPDPRLGRTPRELYQQFGSVCRVIDPDVWLRPFRTRVENMLSAGRRVVCTDLRTPEELRMAREMGAAIWRIERSGAGAPGAMALDATERALSGLPPEAFDRVIGNDGSLAQLHQELERALVAPTPPRTA